MIPTGLVRSSTYKYISEGFIQKLAQLGERYVRRVENEVQDWCLLESLSATLTQDFLLIHKFML